MAPKKKTERAAAEAAYANLLKENTARVGDVGESFGAYVAALQEAISRRERYETARAAAIKGGVLTSDQLDQMGYKKTSKLPAVPVRATQGADAGSVAPRNGAAVPPINSPAG